MEAIKVVKRDSQTKANQLRRHDIVPCCVYGRTLKESISIQMEKKHAKKLFRTKRTGSKVFLDVDGHIIPTQIEEKKMCLNGDMEQFSSQALSEDKRVNSVAHIKKTPTWSPEICLSCCLKSHFLPSQKI